MKVDVDVDVDVDKKQNESSQILLCWKNLGWLFFSMYQPAFSLSFVFLLASKGRQNRPAGAVSPKKKNPSVAPAKLALVELGLASQLQGYTPFFGIPGLNAAQTVAAADTTGSFFFPSERPTFGQ
jgi:hypothetical protein